MTDQLALATGDPQLLDWAGVTTVCQAVLNPGDPLLKWAWKQGQRGILLSDRTAAHQGNLHHKAFELLCEGGRPDIQALPVGARTRIESLVAWWDDTKPKILLVEAALHHDELRFRGRLDYVRACTRRGHECAGEGVVLGDHKTGSTDDLDATGHHHAGPKNRWQVGGAYRLLWEDADATQLPARLLGRPICECELVQIPNHGPFNNGRRYAVRPAGDTRDQFKAALTLYRDMQAVGDLPQATL